MIELFKRSGAAYSFPDGSKKTSEEMASDAQYAFLFDKTYAIEVIDNVIQSYISLANLANQYGIDYSSDSDQNPQDILNEVLDKRERFRTNPPLSITDTVRMAASFAALSFTDEQAVQVSDLYPEYEVNHAYKQNDRFTYKGRLYKVNQAHTSQEQWVPGETGTESLYTCLEMAEDGYLVWTQPTGAHNAYNTGDIVHYPTKDDQLYKSLIDGNTTVPGSDERWWETYTAE